MDYHVVIPLSHERLSALEFHKDDHAPIGRLLFIGSRDEVQFKLHELHRAVRDALYIAGTSPLEHELRAERERVVAALRRVLSRKTDSRLVEIIIKDLLEEL